MKRCEICGTQYPKWEYSKGKESRTCTDPSCVKQIKKRLWLQKHYNTEETLKDFERILTTDPLFAEWD